MSTNESTDGQKGQTERPTFLSDIIEAEYRGEEIVIWNHLTVVEGHYVMPNQIESSHEISCGDAPGNGSPDYITPEMDEKLRALDVYPNAEVVDPHDEEVTIL